MTYPPRRSHGHGGPNVSTDIRLDTAVMPVQALGSRATPRWVDRLFIGLVIYALACTVWMLAGVGGPKGTHYVGLVADAPARRGALLSAAPPPPHPPPRPLRA